MNFRRGAERDEPEINLIPLIDLFLVIIIFLMVTTTYSRFAQLQITLPTADAEKATLKPSTIDVGITADGHYAIDGVPVSFHDVDSIAAALGSAARERKDPVVVISADAQSTTQTVVNVMQAARNAQINQITFATQTTRGK
jgi:biopolymer transport protein ExbD